MNTLECKTKLPASKGYRIILHVLLLKAGFCRDILLTDTGGSKHLDPINIGPIAQKGTASNTPLRSRGAARNP